MAKRTVDQTQTVTTSTMRMETPKSSRQPKPKVTAFIPEDINPASGFVKFIRENAVVGLAVGFVVGAQVQLVVRQLIDSFINPLFLLLLGQDLSTRSFTVHFNGRTASFTWGSFAYSLLSFLFVLLIIYIIIKFLKLDKLDKPKKK